MSESGAFESGASKPGHTEPGHTEPGHTESGRTEPGHTESGRTEPGHTESGQAGSGPAASRRTPPQAPPAAPTDRDSAPEPPRPPSAGTSARATQRTLLEVRAPSPFVSVLITGWLMIAGVLLLAYVFATLFPTIGGLLLIVAPVAVLGAVGIAAWRVSRIRLTVTDQVVRVSDGRTGHAADRSEVRSGVLVESLARKRFGRRTTDLILLDRDGRCALLMSGQLWPPAILEQVIDLLDPVPVERLEGRQTPLTLAARYPKILQNSDGSHRYQPKPRTY